MPPACGLPGAEIARRRAARPFLVHAAFAALLVPQPARALHLADGILPLGWAALWTAAVVRFVAVALRVWPARPPPLTVEEVGWNGPLS